MENQFAVVTGASSGIGLELAKIFAKNHFDLLICSEDREIEKAALDVAKFGVQVEPVQADLARPEGVEKIYARIAHRPVAALAINAGGCASGAFARRGDLRAELSLIDLNVRSTVHLAKLVLMDMVRRGEGKILFTSSVPAAMPGRFEAVCSASKAFLQSFSRAIREEVKETGVTVTALLPGPAQSAQQGYDAMVAGKESVAAGSFIGRLLSKAGNRKRAA